jgi:hypothetical protein
MTESCEAARVVPVIVTEDGENDVVGPAGEIVADRLTVPVKPPVPGAIVMLKRATDPALMVAVSGFAEILKVSELNVTATEWDNEPLVPVTVTTVLVRNVQVRVEVPEPTTLAALREQDEPALWLRLTVPAKPFTGAIVMVELPEGEAFTVVGFAVIVKSVGVNVTVVVWERGLPAPVTVTVVVTRGGVNVQDRIELPDPVTLVGLSVHAALLTDRLTIPLKPLSAVTAMVDVAVPPVDVTEDGLALREKSTTWKAATAEWDRGLLVAVTVTLLLPAAVYVQVRVTEADLVVVVSTTLAVLREHTVPPFCERLTVPVNPFSAVTVIVDVPALPASTAEGDVALIEKSKGALNVNVAVVPWLSEPLAPFIVTVKLPGLEELHVNVAVPEPVTLLGLILPQDRPLGIVSVNPTVPVKPFTALIVIVDVAVWLVLTAAGDVALIVKSWGALNVNAALVECVNEPLVPVIGRENVPSVVEEQETVAVPDPVMLLDDIEPQVRPDGTVSVSETVPRNPLRAVIVIVEVADWLVLTAAGEEAAMLKSWKLKLAVAEWGPGGDVPFVPVMIRLYVVANVALHDTVAEPLPVTLLGVIAPHVSPEGIVSVNETVPAKLLSAVIVMVEVADCPESTAAGELAVIVKSGAGPKVKVAVIVWLNDPLLPVIITLYALWFDERHERVAVPEPVTLLTLIGWQTRPLGGLLVRRTVPVKPFRAVTVMVDTAEEPTAEDGEVAVIVKSTKL